MIIAEISHSLLWRNNRPAVLHWGCSYLQGVWEGFLGVRTSLPNCIAKFILPTQFLVLGTLRLLMSAMIIQKTIHQMVQEVQKHFSFQMGCGLQNELRTAATDHYEINRLFYNIIHCSWSSLYL